MKKNILIFGVLLVAMLLADLYLIKNVSSIVAYVASGVLTLGAAYLFFCEIYSAILQQRAEKETFQAYIKEHCEETQKADKAKYLMMKRTQELLDEKLSQIEAAQAQLQDAILQLSEEQTKNAKIIVKYSREDSKKLAALSRQDMEKLIAAINDNGENQLAALAAIEKSNERLLSEGVSVGIQPTAVVEETPIVDELPEAEEIVVAEEEPEMEEAPAEEIVAEEAPVPELDLSDPNKQMGQDDIAALLASMGVGDDSPAAEEEPEPEVEEIPAEEEVAAAEAPAEAPVPELDLSDPNKQMGQDDIAALLASMGVGDDSPAEEEPEVEEMLEEEVAATEAPAEAPVPELDLSDPNKQMGQDDIAALLASMGVGDDSPAVEEPELEVEEIPVEEAMAEEAPAPELDLSDPNKQLGPDEIAALFSSLG